MSMCVSSLTIAMIRSQQGQRVHIISSLDQLPVLFSMFDGKRI
jgi:hypothetical protein